jgi:D-glycero-alpha-D-manno-heptose 1-phosphate guanylyltransferase
LPILKYGDPELKLLVLAGGFGSRLQSVLPGTPKALAPIGDVPFLALQIENWVAQGISSFIFLLHHHADQITDFLGNASSGLLKDCEVESLIEPTPMDTGGAVAHAVGELKLNEDFLVTNADTWLGSGIQELIASAAPAMAVIRLDDCSRYGQVRFDERHRVTAFTEKSATGGPGWINAGLCRLSADMFRTWDGARFSLERQTFPALVQRGELRAVTIQPDFIDIGIPEDYQRFCRWIEGSRKGKLCK